MSPEPFRLVHVDDEAGALSQARELLEDDEAITALGGVEVTSFDNFPEALDHLDNTFTDIVILDVMKEHGVTEVEPELAGRDAFEQLRSKVFVPVIFYTGFAHRIADLQEDLKLLRVVEKGNADRLLEAVAGVLEEGLPTLNRGLLELLRKVQRDYMWEFVAHHWPQFREQDDRMALAHLLVRRFALSLSTDGAMSLMSALPGAGDGPSSPGNDEKVHPISMYVMPPLPEARPMAGDVRRGQIDGAGDYWIVLTPSCDFAQGRAETVLLAACQPLQGQPELSRFLAEPEDGNKRGSLKALMKNGNVKGRQADRHHFLPGAFNLPDLLVDLRSLKTIPREQFDALEAVVSLDAPFAEALLSQFSRYVGRLGTPDPDFDLVIERLREADTDSED
jgi:CheY-like chemotaxis protein